MRAAGVRATLLAFVVAAAALVAPAAASAKQPPAASAPAYVAVIDAGSSGSRITLFESDPSANLVPVTLFSARGKDSGIDDRVTDPESAGEHVVAPLLEALSTELRTRGIDPAAVEVTLLATAGLRMIQKAKPAAARRILNSARGAIAASGNRVGDVAVMSGTQEAAFAWLDANALQKDAGAVFGETGTIEIGGASAQIAFASPGATNQPAITLRVNGRPYRIVALSYLGLGLDAARMSMYQATGGAKPCYPNSLPTEAPAAFTVGPEATVVGASADYRPVTCSRAYAVVVSRTGTDRFNTQQTGGIAPRDVRNLPGFARSRFALIGSGSYVLADFGISDTVDDDQLLQAALRRTCTGPDAWSKVVTQFRDSRGAIAQTACANATFLHTWLFGRQGLGVEADQLANDASVEGRTPSWSRGFALTVLAP